jgi:hypothetical protein
LFTLNGRTGYVLKPDVLRVKGPEKDKEMLAKATKYILDITVGDSEKASLVEMVGV